jgi:uncharacterized protein (TIGR03083 family)
MSLSKRVTSLVGQSGEVATGLSDYLDRLPPAEWVEPSDCHGWTIAAVVGHLILVEALISSSVRRGLGGDSSPPPEAAAGVEAWREYRSREIARLSAETPPELLARYQDGLGTIQEALDDLAASDTDTRQGWHPSGLKSLPWFAGQWMVEIALHDWDIRVSRDSAAEVNPAALPSLGAEMRARMSQCFKPRSQLDSSGAVRIELGGPAPLAWVARLADEQLGLLEDGAAQSDATIRTDPGAYALVQTARRPAKVFEQQGRWRVDGDVRLANRLAASFTGY